MDVIVGIYPNKVVVPGQKAKLYLAKRCCVYPSHTDWVWHVRCWFHAGNHVVAVVEQPMGVAVAAVCCPDKVAVVDVSMTLPLTQQQCITHADRTWCRMVPFTLWYLDEKLPKQPLYKSPPLSFTCILHWHYVEYFPSHDSEVQWTPTGAQFLSWGLIFN